MFHPKSAIIAGFALVAIGVDRFQATGFDHVAVNMLALGLAFLAYAANWRP